MKSISGKKLCKLLLAYGWTHTYTVGSHFRFEKNGKGVSVPVHANKDLKIGTLKALMRAAGLTEADLQ
ncbi:MAG: type II toxin-antitoxin system HicA family toxin [Ignavibacteria bacterium]|jgi:predicted RNA binding protein YcfA (HicA-like mRNA interferase family)|nr:type II toxin-antitoxin system HicA family toxin [Ignavibacteria bacterium]